MMKFIKLSVVLTFLGLAIFDRGEWLYPCFLSVWLFIVVAAVKSLIKTRKRQPGESDEDYAKRMESLTRPPNTSSNDPYEHLHKMQERMRKMSDDFYYSPMNAHMPCNIYYRTPVNPNNRTGF